MWLLDLDRLVWVQAVTQSTSSTPREDNEKEKEREEQKSEREYRAKEQYWPVGRRDHAAVVYSSRLYIIGGKGQASYPKDYICTFDLSKHSASFPFFTKVLLREFAYIPCLRPNKYPPPFEQWRDTMGPCVYMWIWQPWPG